MPFWIAEVQPRILGEVIVFSKMYILSFIYYCVAGEAVLCVAHGTSLRGIVKHIEQLSDEEICSLDLPNGIPIVYRSGHGYRWIIVTSCLSVVRLDQNLNMKVPRQYLADTDTVDKAVKKVSKIVPEKK